MAILEIRNLSKNFGNRKILDKINMDINEGEMVAITGVSGKEKSKVFELSGGEQQWVA